MRRRCREAAAAVKRRVQAPRPERRGGQPERLARGIARAGLRLGVGDGDSREPRHTAHDRADERRLAAAPQGKPDHPTEREQREHRRARRLLERALDATHHGPLQPREVAIPELVDALARICVEPGGHRELAMAAEDHMPAWRRRIRLHTGEIPAVRPHQTTAQAQWSSTDPHRLVHLVEPAYDAERDGVRVSPAAAERLLASSASDASPDPFDTTTPDRPTFDPEHQHAEAFLSPPPTSADLDAPVIPTTRGSHPVVDLNHAPHSSTRVGSWEDRAPSPPPPPMPAPTSRPPHVEVELPAYQVSPSGTLTPVKPRGRSTAWIGWAIGLGALALLLVPCGLFALVAAMSAAAIAGGGFQPQLGGSPRVGTGGGASSELFTWLGPYPPALVDLNGDGYLDPIGFTWDFGGTDAVSAISGADASVLWVHPGVPGIFV